MALADILRDMYRRAEDVFYSILDWLDEHRIPVYRLVDAFEDRGIPAFPVFLAMLLFLIAGAAIVFLPSATPTRSVVITVQDVNGNPVVGATVVLHASGGVTLRQITDSMGNAYFDDVPEGPYSYEVIKDGRKIGEKSEVNTDYDTITLSPTGEGNIKFCVQPIDAETGQTIPQATVTGGGTTFSWYAPMYCAYVPLGTTVSVSAEGYQPTTVVAQEGYSEKPYIVKLEPTSPSDQSNPSSSGYTLTVLVLYEGSPVAADVRLIQGSKQLEKKTSASSGTVTFPGLAPGAYTIVVTGTGAYSNLRAEKDVNLYGDQEVTIDLKEEGEVIQPPADAPMKGEQKYRYSITINGSQKLLLRVGSNQVHVCAKTGDSSVDTVKVTFTMDGKTIGGPAYMSVTVNNIQCTDITVNAEKEGSATATISFQSGSNPIKTYSIGIPVKLVRYSVVVCAKGDDGHTLSGASVKVGNESDTTGDNGCATFTLPPGQYPVHIEAQGYHPLDDEIDVASNTTKTFTLAADLSAQGYHCQNGECFVVLYNGLPSSKIESITAGKPLQIKACVKGNGTYGFTVSNNGKAIRSTSIYSSGSTSCTYVSVVPQKGTLTSTFLKAGKVAFQESLTVSVKEYNVTIEVLDEENGTPITGASVSVGDVSGTTDENGYVTLRVPMGRWTYKVTAAHHLPASGTLYVYTDISRTIRLIPGEPGKGWLEVCVYDEFNHAAVPSATVHVGTETWETGENGCAAGYIEKGKYDVWAEKDGYVDSAKKTVRIVSEMQKVSIKLFMRPDTEGSVLLTGIIAGTQPVAVLGPGTFRIKFSVTAPGRAVRATLHVYVDEAQDVLSINGGKSASLFVPTNGKTVGESVTLTVSPVSEPTTLPIYYYLEYSDGTKEYNIPAGGGMINVTVYPFKAIPCYHTGVGVAIYAEQAGTRETYLQAGVDNDVKIILATCKEDVSVTGVELTVKTPGGETKTTTLSGSPSAPYQPVILSYKIKPSLKEVSQSYHVKAVVKKDTSSLAVSERAFRVTYYQRDICLSVSTTPREAVPNSPLSITIKPHLCQSPTQLPLDWAEHSSDIKITLSGGSAISSSEVGKTIGFATTLTPVSNGDIVLSCSSAYYTCQFEGGGDTYVIWVYKSGLLSFEYSTYTLPIISGARSNAITLRLLNYTPYPVDIQSIKLDCGDSKKWVVKVDNPGTVPALDTGTGEPGEADVRVSATWMGSGAPTGGATCTLKAYGVYTAGDKQYALTASTEVAISSSFSGIQLATPSSITVTSGTCSKIKISAKLPPNVPYSEPLLEVTPSSRLKDIISTQVDSPKVLRAPKGATTLVYTVYVCYSGEKKLSAVGKLDVKFSVRLGSKEVDTSAGIQTQAKYVPKYVTVSPAKITCVIWPDGKITCSSKTLTVKVVNKGVVGGLQLDYMPDGGFYTVSIEKEKGSSNKYKVTIKPVEEKLGSEPQQGTTEVTFEYALSWLPGESRTSQVQIPITVYYVPKNCIELELSRKKIHSNEKTMLIVKNNCAVELKSVNVYQVTGSEQKNNNENGSSGKARVIQTLTLKPGEPFYIEVPITQLQCKNEEKEKIISFYADAGHGLVSPAVTLTYECMPTASKQRSVSTCGSGSIPVSVPLIYDPPFSSVTETTYPCTAAYCGAEEFREDLKKELESAMKKALEDASRFSTSDQIPGCKAGAGWCKLPVYSFTLHAKEGIKIADPNTVVPEGTLGVWTSSAPNTEELKPGEFLFHGEEVDGCGTYTFTVTPYVSVTRTAVNPGVIAYVVNVDKKGCTIDLFSSPLLFNFASSPNAAEKAKLAKVCVEASNYVTLLSKIDSAVEDLLKGHAVITENVSNCSNADIVIRASKCGKGDNYCNGALASVSLIKNKQLEFNFYVHADKQITEDTVKKIIEGWLEGPFTKVSFSGCDDQSKSTFYIYGVSESEGAGAVSYGEIPFMPGIPFEIDMSKIYGKICGEGEYCTYQVVGISVSFSSSGGKEISCTYKSNSWTCNSNNSGKSSESASSGENLNLEITRNTKLKITLDADSVPKDAEAGTLVIKLERTNRSPPTYPVVTVGLKIIGFTRGQVYSAILAPNGDPSKLTLDKYPAALAEALKTEADNVAEIPGGYEINVWVNKLSGDAESVLSRLNPNLFINYDVQWPDVGIDIRTATHNKRMKFAGSPTGQITYFGGCMGTAGVCDALIPVLGWADIVGSAAACGMTALLGAQSASTAAASMIEGASKATGWPEWGIALLLMGNPYTGVPMAVQGFGSTTLSTVSGASAPLAGWGTSLAFRMRAIKRVKDIAQTLTNMENGKITTLKEFEDAAKKLDTAWLRAGHGSIKSELEQMLFENALEGLEKEGVSSSTIKELASCLTIENGEVVVKDPNKLKQLLSRLSVKEIEALQEAKILKEDEPINVLKILAKKGDKTVINAIKGSAPDAIEAALQKGGDAAKAVLEAIPEEGLELAGGRFYVKIEEGEIRVWAREKYGESVGRYNSGDFYKWMENKDLLDDFAQQLTQKADPDQLVDVLKKAGKSDELLELAAKEAAKIDVGEMVNTWGIKNKVEQAVQGTAEKAAKKFQLGQMAKEAALGMFCDALGMFAGTAIETGVVMNQHGEKLVVDGSINAAPGLYKIEVKGNSVTITPLEVKTRAS